MISILSISSFITWRGHINTAPAGNEMFYQIIYTDISNWVVISMASPKSHRLSATLRTTCIQEKENHYIKQITGFITYERMELAFVTPCLQIRFRAVEKHSMRAQCHSGGCPRQVCTEFAETSRRRHYLTGHKFHGVDSATSQIGLNPWWWRNKAQLVTIGTLWERPQHSTQDSSVLDIRLISGV
jgi:hypothetical protein